MADIRPLGLRTLGLLNAIQRLRNVPVVGIEKSPASIVSMNLKTSISNMISLCDKIAESDLNNLPQSYFSVSIIGNIDSVVDALVEINQMITTGKEINDSKQNELVDRIEAVYVEIYRTFRSPRYGIGLIEWSSHR